MAETATIGILRVLLQADSSGFESGLNKAEAATSGWSSKLGGVVGVVETVGLAIAGLGTTLVGLATDAAESGDKIAKAAREAGLSAQSYQEIFFAVGQIAKITEEQLTKAFSRLTTTIGEAANGSKTATQALTDLGFPLERIREGSITTEEAFNAFLQRVREAPTATEAARIAAEVFGDRAGPKLAGALREGGAQVDVLRQQFRDLGLGMSGEALAAAEKWKDQTDTLSRQFAALGREIGTVFLPFLTDTLVPFIQSSVIPALKLFVDMVSSVIQVFQSLPGPVQGAIAGIAGLIGFIGTLALAFDALVLLITPLLPLFGTTMPAVLAAAGGALSALLGPIALVVAAVGGLILIWVKWGDDIKRITVDVWNTVAGAFSTAMNFIVNLWNSFSTAVVQRASAMMLSVKQWLVDFWEGSIFQSIARMLQALVELYQAVWARILVEVAKFVLSVQDWLVAKFQAVIDGVRGMLTRLSDAWTTAKTAVLTVVQSVYEGVKSWLVDKLTPLFTTIRNFFQPIITAWTTAKDAVVNVVTALYTGVKTWLVDKFVEIVNSVKAKIDAVTEFFRVMKDKVVGNSYVPEMMVAIGAQFATLHQLMVVPTQEATEDVKALFREMRDGVNQRVDELMDQLGQSAEQYEPAIVNPTDMATNEVADMFESMRGGVGSSMAGLIGNIQAQTGRYPSVLENPTSATSRNTQGIFEGLSGGVQQIVGGLFDKVQGKTVNWGSMFEGLIHKISGSTQNIFQALSGATQQIVSGMFDSLLGKAVNWGNMFMGILTNIIGAGINSLVSWGLGQLGNLVNHFRGGEEGTQVNPARDQFLAQFGGSGTGPGSGFWELGARLEGAVGSAQAEALHAALRSADTMAEFNAAVSAINSALGGGGFTGGFTTPSPTTSTGSIAPSWVGMEAPEEEMGVMERMARGMAHGGFGRVDRPTLFLAGEGGPEDVAFSGANKSFTGGGTTVQNIFNGDVYGLDDFESTVMEATLHALRMNRNSALTRLQAVAEIR